METVFENLPVVAKLAFLYPCLDLYVFSRDDNLDIMDKYITNGKRTIPMFVFFDETGKEIGRLVERPREPGFLAREMEKYEDLPERKERRLLTGFVPDFVSFTRQGLEMRPSERFGGY